MARVKCSSSRARVRANLKIISDISFEMLWMSEKLLVISWCGVEYSSPVSQRPFLPGEKQVKVKISLTTFAYNLDGCVCVCVCVCVHARVKRILDGVSL